MGQKGKPRRAAGEGTLEYVPSEDRWRIRLSVKNLDGTVRRKTFTAKTQKEVIRKRDEWRAGGGPILPAGRDTVLSEYLGRWLATYVKANVSAGTRTRYEQACRCDIVPLLGHAKISEITPGHVEDLRDRMLAEGDAPDTVRYVLGVLSTALAHAERRHLIPSNPAAGDKVSRPKRRKAMRALTEEQAGRLVATSRGTRFEALYVVAMKLGLRQGELCGLKWGDLDPDRRLLTVERSVDTRSAGSRWGSTKGGEARTILLPPSVAATLERHRKMQLEARLATRSWGDPTLIFPITQGNVQRRNPLVSHFRKDLETAGLPKIRFHDLRHTAATLMLRAGVPVNTAAQILGHADPSITLRRYAHVLGDMQETAALRIDKYAF